MNEEAIVRVRPGTLVVYQGLGIAVNADYNDPELGSRPYVTVNTEELDPRYVYGDELPMIAVHLNHTDLFDDQGAGNVAPIYDAPTVYVVTPAEAAESVAVVAKLADAHAFAATFAVAPAVEEAVVANWTLARRMIDERG